MAGWWRGMVMGIIVFAAIATPSTDPLRMLALAGPIVRAVLHRGRHLAPQRPPARRDDPDAELDDDEASELDLTPEAVGEIEPVSAPGACPSRRR